MGRSSCAQSYLSGIDGMSVPSCRGAGFLACHTSAGKNACPTVAGWKACPTSEDVPAQIFLLQDAVQPPAHVGAIDADVLVRQVRRVVADLLDDALQDRVQPARPDVLRGAVDLEG